MSKRKLYILLLVVFVLLISASFIIENKNMKGNETNYYNHLAMTLEGSTITTPPTTGYYYMQKTCEGMDLIWDSGKRSLKAIGVSGGTSTSTCKMDFQTLNMNITIDGVSSSTVPLGDYILNSSSCGTATVTYDRSSISIIATTKPTTCSLSFLEVKLSLSSTSGSFYVGRSSKTVTISGSNYGTLSCSTSASSVATCSISGTTLTITPKTTNGTATITVKEGTLNKTVTYTVTSTYQSLYNGILAAETPQSDASIDFSITSEAGNTNGLYYVDNASTYGEDSTTVYYYRGDIDNNWVTFGGYLWRIVRTTSEGGVRLVYSGDGSSITSGFISTNTMFNSTANSKYYVGYTYNTSSYTGTQTDSTIKGEIDSWYSTWVQSNSVVPNYLSTTAVYCNDRSSERTKGAVVYYPAYDRLYVNKRPSFACASTNGSKYTVSTSTGNGYLSNPIALLTADEVYYAGLVFSGNGTTTTTYILDNAGSGSATLWWLMTPGVLSTNAYEFIAYGTGTFSYNTVNSTSRNVRPAISLKSCISVVGGLGSQSSPYVLSNANC